MNILGDLQCITGVTKRRRGVMVYEIWDDVVYVGPLRCQPYDDDLLRCVSRLGLTTFTPVQSVQTTCNIAASTPNIRYL